jgi:uridine kinase
MATKNFEKKSICIGVAGDSASGKDTFADAVVQLLGSEAVTVLSGDNYHFWDREKPAWEVVTHLNPMANDLSRYARDLAALAAGDSVEVHEYDHSFGRSSELSVIEARQIIVAQGLHALYSVEMRSQYDLQIYLDVDEDIRRKFKIKRDVRERGHQLDEVIATFERREADSIDFVRPQAQYADVVFSIRSDNFEALGRDSCEEDLSLYLEVKKKNKLYSEDLTANLENICKLDIGQDLVDGTPILRIRGALTEASLSEAAANLCPKALNLTRYSPLWKNDIVGLIQLITLYEIEHLI